MFRPPVFNPDVLAVDIADLFQPLSKTAQKFGGHVERSRVEPADNWHPSLLRPRRERPCGRRAAEQRDELAPPHHSMTSSARASNMAGTSRPSALATVRLMTNSNLVGCSTGRSPGFAPRRILST